MIREAVREIHKYIARPSNAVIRLHARSHPSAHATRCARTNVNSGAFTKRGSRVFCCFFFSLSSGPPVYPRKKSRHFLSKSQQRQPHLLFNNTIFSRCDRAVLNTCKTGGKKKKPSHTLSRHNEACFKASSQESSSYVVQKSVHNFSDI